MQKRLTIIYLIKKRNALYLKKTHKFGNEVPESVAQACALDKKNINILRADAIAKEMKNLSPALKKLYNGGNCDNWIPAGKFSYDF